MRSKLFGGIGALASMLSGCFAVTLWDQDKIPQDDQVVDTRVSSRQADLGGHACYVERQHRVTSRIDIPDRGFILFGAALEAVSGGASSGTSNDSTNQIIGAAMVGDVVLTFVYILFRQDKATVSTRWEETSETATCAP